MANPGNQYLHEEHLNTILTEFVRQQRNKLLHLFFDIKRNKPTKYNTSEKAWDMVVKHQHVWNDDLFKAFWQIGGGVSWCHSESNWRQWLHDALLVAAEVKSYLLQDTRYDPKEVGKFVDECERALAKRGTPDATILHTTLTTQVSIAFIEPDLPAASAGRS